MSSILPCPWCVEDEDKQILYDSETIKEHARSVHPEVLPSAPAPQVAFPLPEQEVILPAPIALPEEPLPVVAAAAPHGSLYGCELCNVSFDTLSSYTDHLRDIHPSSLPPPGGWIPLADAPPSSAGGNLAASSAAGGSLAAAAPPPDEDENLLDEDENLLGRLVWSMDLYPV